MTRNKIISDTPNTTCNMSIDADITFNGNMLNMFQLTSEVEVKEIIIKSPNKSHDYLAFEEMCGSPSTTDNNHCQ